jgi:hypothetical protein
MLRGMTCLDESGLPFEVAATQIGTGYFVRRTNALLEAA